MNIYKVLGMALWGAVMCTTFTSCENEDVSGPEAQSSKQLISIKDEFYDSEGVTSFEYNNNGRLTDIYEKYKYNSEEREERSHYKYVWYGDESINVTYTEDGRPDYAPQTNIKLRNDKITSYDGAYETAQFFYDQDNRLIKIETVNKGNGKENAFTFKWSDDNMYYISEGIEKEEYSMTLTYDKSLEGPYLFYKAATYMFLLDSEFINLVTAHPELIGKQSKNAIASIRALEEGIEDEYVELEYEFGKSSVTVRDKVNDETYWTSTLLWK